jgi:hypothetical protein
MLAAMQACSDQNETTVPSSPPEGDSASAGTGKSSQSPSRDPSVDDNSLRPGQWRTFRTHKFDENLTDEQREMMEKLESVGYTSGSARANTFKGVTVYNRQKAHDGLNFLTSGHGQEAILMDMKGRVLHRWSCKFWDVWPDYPIPRNHEMAQFWRRARLLENGDVLAIYEGLGLVKLDKDSAVIWANSCRAHHDLDFRPDGDIYVLTREARIVPRVAEGIPILEDFVSVLSADGKEKKRISLLECFENSQFSRFARPEGKARFNPDIFHANTLEILYGEIADRAPAFRKGNILTSLLNLDAIAVVDLDQKKAVWVHTGNFDKQHDPRILENGNLMLFDNNRQTGCSRILEFDPVDGAMHWVYRGTEESPFYSRTCGIAQRLLNGNTLITESDNGRAFEVTREKDIVWQFYNPHRAGANQEYVAVLFEVIRINPEFTAGWLSRSKKKDED